MIYVIYKMLEDDECFWRKVIRVWNTQAMGIWGVRVEFIHRVERDKMEVTSELDENSELLGKGAWVDSWVTREENGEKWTSLLKQNRNTFIVTRERYGSRIY